MNTKEQKMLESLKRGEDSTCARGIPAKQHRHQLSREFVEHIPPQGRAYYSSLDGLRAVSFFGVFLWHYMDVPYGWAGVDVFFVLSGFLITGILYDTRDDPHRVRNFYIRRTLRIFPLYYGVFLAAFLLTPFLHWAWTWQWVAWPLYLGNFLAFLYPHLDNDFVRNFVYGHLASRAYPESGLTLGHFWTLCVEEQFYLLWPWIVFTVRDRRKLVAICCACIMLVPLARHVAMAHMPESLLNNGVILHSTPFRFDTLLFGALIALLYRGGHRKQMQRAAQAILAIATLGVLSVCVYWFRFRSVHLHDAAERHTWLLSLIALSSGALMLRTLLPGTIAYRIFNLRWLRLIGTVSYGGYVFHDILHGEYRSLVAYCFDQGVMARYFHHSALAHYLHLDVDTITAIFALIMTLTLAFLSYHFFESPILRMKDRFTSSNAR
jgi:peptidoglycan/LPS O-acetylase OafA/YrhL